MPTVLASVAPLSPVIVSVAVNEPAATYVWLGLAVVDVPPSPKSHKRLYVPSESPDPADEKATVRGSLPEVGTPAAAAVGGWFAATTTVWVAVLCPPALSVTVSVTMWVPGVVMAWVALAVF